MYCWTRVIFIHCHSFCVLCLCVCTHVHSCVFTACKVVSDKIQCSSAAVSSLSGSALTPPRLCSQRFWAPAQRPNTQSRLDHLLLSGIWKTTGRVFLQAQKFRGCFFLSPYFQIWHFLYVPDFYDAKRLETLLLLQVLIPSPFCF